MLSEHFADVTPSAGDRYFLVVALDGAFEGSYGTMSDGSERPRAGAACVPDQEVTACE